MLSEGVAASLIAEGISSAIGLTHSEINRRLRDDAGEISQKFSNIFITEIEEEFGKHSDALREDDLDIIFSLVNDRFDRGKPPGVEEVQTVLIDGFMTVLGDEYSERKIEESIETAYEVAVNKLIDDITGTDLGERLLINSQLEQGKSIDSIEEKIEKIQALDQHQSTYRMLNVEDYSSNEISSLILEESQSDNGPCYVEREETPDKFSERWYLFVGRKGLGKTRTLAYLAKKAVQELDIEHIIVPKRSLSSPGDLEALLQEDFTGDVLLVWDDLQDLGEESFEQKLREILFKLDDCLDEDSHELFVISSVQADAVTTLYSYKKNTNSLWESLEVIELQPLNTHEIRTLVSRLSHQHNLDLEGDVFERTIEKIYHSDPSPMYAKSVIASLSSQASEPSVKAIEDIHTDIVSVWESLYSSLRRNYPNTRFILWGIELLRLGGIPPYKSTLRKLFTELFGQDRFEFEESISVLKEKQWITKSKMPELDVNEPIYRSHDLQMEAVDEDSNRVISEFSELLLGPLEETFPAEVSDWIPHYHSNFALALFMEIIDDTEDLAFPHFERAIELAPLNPVVRLNYGETLASLGHLEKAIEQYETALKVVPEWVELRHSYAFALDLIGQKPKARQEYERVIELSPSHNEARVNYAKLLTEIGERYEAKKQYKKSIDQGYATPDVYNNYGILCQNSGDIRKAEEIFQKGLDIHPGSVALRTNLAALLFKTRRPKSAKELMLPIFGGGNPKDPDAHRNFAIILASLNEDEKSQYHLEQAKAKSQKSEDDLQDLDSTVESADCNLEKYEDLPDGFKYADYLRDEGHYKKAKDEYSGLLDKGHESEEVYRELAEICVKLEEPRDAEAYFEAASEISPDDPRLHMRFGNFYKHQGRYEEAIEQFEKALEVSDNINIINDYALCLFQAGKHERAEKEFRKIIEEKGKDAAEIHRIHLNYGNLLKITEREEMAIEHFERAIEIAPDYCKAKLALGGTIIDDDPERAFNLLKNSSEKLLREGNVSEGIRGFQMAIDANENSGNIDEAIELCDIILEQLQRVALPQAKMYQAGFRMRKRELLKQQDSH